MSIFGLLATSPLHARKSAPSLQGACTAHYPSLEPPRPIYDNLRRRSRLSGVDHLSHSTSCPRVPAILYACIRVTTHQAGEADAPFRGSAPIISSQIGPFVRRVR